MIIIMYNFHLASCEIQPLKSGVQEKRKKSVKSAHVSTKQSLVKKIYSPSKFRSPRSPRKVSRHHKPTSQKSAHDFSSEETISEEKQLKRIKQPFLSDSSSSDSETATNHEKYMHEINLTPGPSDSIINKSSTSYSPDTSSMTNDSTKQPPLAEQSTNSHPITSSPTGTIETTVNNAEIEQPAQIKGNFIKTPPKSREQKQESSVRIKCRPTTFLSPRADHHTPAKRDALMIHQAPSHTEENVSSSLPKKRRRKHDKNGRSTDSEQFTASKRCASQGARSKLPHVARKLVLTDHPGKFPGFM